MTRRLIHYSINPLKEIRSVRQPPGPYYFHVKPHGLWVSVEGDDDWLSWCQGERWGLESLKCATEIVLKKDASLLRLTSAKEICDFEDKFKGKKEGDFDVHIIWPKVAEQYQGIVIAPYCWQLRLEKMWYYGWDCASGCIWDADAVASLKQIEWGYAA